MAKQPRLIAIYAQQMQEIKRRFEVVDFFLQLKGRPWLIPIRIKNDNCVASPCRAAALSAASRLVLLSNANWNYPSDADYENLTTGILASILSQRSSG